MTRKMKSSRYQRHCSSKDISEKTFFPIGEGAYQLVKLHDFHRKNNTPPPHAEYHFFFQHGTFRPENVRPLPCSQNTGT